MPFDSHLSSILLGQTICGGGLEEQETEGCSLNLRTKQGVILLKDSEVRDLDGRELVGDESEQAEERLEELLNAALLTELRESEDRLLISLAGGGEISGRPHAWSTHERPGLNLLTSPWEYQEARECGCLVAEEGHVPYPCREHAEEVSEEGKKTPYKEVCGGTIRVYGAECQGCGEQVKAFGWMEFYPCACCRD